MEWQVPLSEGTARCDTESTEVSFHSCQMGKSVLCFLLRAGSHTQLPFFLGGGQHAAPVCRARRTEPKGQTSRAGKGAESRGLAGSPQRERKTRQAALLNRTHRDHTQTNPE